MAVIKPRRGIKSLWNTYKNRVYQHGEMLVESPESGVGTGPVNIKFGDGVTPYGDLPYAIQAPISECVEGSEKPLTSGAGYDLKKQIDYLDNFVTPEMFGAVGDGITDDTSAFISASKFPIIKCQNVYNIKNTIELENVKIIGGVFYDNTATKLFDIKSNVTIENVSIIGDGNFSDNGNYTFYIKGNNVTIKGNKFHNISKGNTIFCIDSENINISKNDIENYSTNGIMLFMTCKFIKVNDNKVSNSKVGTVNSDGTILSYPIGLSGYYGTVEDGRELNHDIICDGNTVINNKFWEGIDAHACYNVVISNNSVHNCKVGIVITPTGNTLPYNCKIINNYIENVTKLYESGRNVNGGISVLGYNHVVTGNTIINAGIGSNYGYGVYARNIENTIFSNNVLKNIMGVGFIIWEAKNISVLNNNINLISPLIEHNKYGTVPIYFDCSSNKEEHIIVKNNICMSDVECYEIVLHDTFSSTGFPKNYVECKGNVLQNIINDVITRDYNIIKDSLPYISSVQIGKVGDFIYNNRKNSETPTLGWLCTTDWVNHKDGVWTEVNL